MKTKNYLLILITVIILFSCTRKIEKEVRLGLVQWVGYSPFYIAEKKDFLPQSVRLIDFPSNQDIIDFFKAKELDVAFLTLDEAIRLKKDGVDFKIVLFIDSSNGADAILAKDYIKSVKDLKSKRVAYEPKSVQEYLLYRALEKNNLTKNDIVPIYLKYDEHLTKENSSYDAIVTFEPYKHKLLKKGMHTIFSSKEISKEIVDLMVVSNETIKNNSNIIQKLVDAFFKGSYYLEKNQDLLSIVSLYLDSETNDIQNSLNDIDILNKEENNQILNKNKILEKVAHINRYLNKDTKNKNEINLLNNIDIEFVKRSVYENKIK